MSLLAPINAIIQHQNRLIKRNQLTQINITIISIAFRQSQHYGVKRIISLHSILWLYLSKGFGEFRNTLCWSAAVNILLNELGRSSFLTFTFINNVPK